MANDVQALTGLPATPRPESVQPGGGWCMQIELAWGRLRRAYLRTCRPGYVRRMLTNRQGVCERFSDDVIDPRDLKYIRNVCGFWFDPHDDHFQWRSKIGLARYGLAEVVLFTLAFVVFTGLFGCLAMQLHGAFLLPLVPAALVWLELIYFFRDPERAIPQEADALVSPADGTVTNVEEVEEPEFPGGKALRVSIFLSIFNVHVNRLPRGGSIVNIRYFPGAFLDARNPESAVRNEQLWIDMEECGRPLRVKQISGAIARRIVCWLKIGETVQKGDRLGMIKLGSRTDLLIPSNAVKEICAKVGAKVRGGASILLRVNPRG
ncbi:MAG: phosphatidylserine decarboxylase family protein [Planctomycetes bacterium]|nr:phosphatidylserine decarboxylase family protein [Planctomycetota bacterium]